MSSATKPKRCSGCQKRIVFAELVKPGGTLGGLVPLDPGAPVYSVSIAEPSLMAKLEELEDGPHGRLRRFMTSHFATCTDPSRFSGGRQDTSPKPRDLRQMFFRGQSLVAARSDSGQLEIVFRRYGDQVEIAACYRPIGESEEAEGCSRTMEISEFIRLLRALEELES